MKKSIILFIIILLIPTISSITCDFSGWNVPKLSPDNTITLDGDLWQAYDQNLGTVYTREIIKVGTEGNPIITDPSLTQQDYFDIANDFLERNEDELNIEAYSDLEFDYEGSYPIVKFLGENQICYDYFVIGSFAGAVKFTEDRVYSIFSKWYKPVEIDDDPPAISGDDAAGAAGAGGGGGGGGKGNKTELAILPLADDTFRLVWDVELDNNSHVYVDAQTGDILNKDDRFPEEKIMKSVQKTGLNERMIIGGIISLSIVVLGLLFWSIINKRSKK